MNKPEVFKNAELGSVRVVMVEKVPYFVGKDVAEILGYKDTSDAIKRHVDDEDKLTRRFTDSGQSREMYIVNESGLYSLILSSKLPSAKHFKKWVTSEVLPSIHKHGIYATDNVIDNIPWIETVPKKYFSPLMNDMRIVPYCNNYLKMHGKYKIRQIAGRKRKRKFNNQFRKNVRNKMRIYLKRKRKGIKHKKNRRLK